MEDNTPSLIINAPAILLVGTTGVGKSTLGNMMLGTSEDENPTFPASDSCFTVTKKSCSAIYKIGDEIYNIIDTPGIYATDVPNEEILKEIALTIQKCAYGIKAILFVLGFGRSPEQVHMINTIKRFFMEEHFRCMILVFSKCRKKQTLDPGYFRKTYWNETIKAFINSIGNRWCISPDIDIFSPGDHVYEQRLKELQYHITSMSAVYTAEITRKIREVNDDIIKNIQIQLSQTTKKFKEEKKKFQDVNQLYKNLQEKYNDLNDKYNEEKNQHQIIVENLKRDIEGIEDKYTKNIQQLENQISDINQQHQTKIKLQEQQINQLQQSIELKETQLQSLEKEKDELNAENDSLYQRNTNLTNQLENTLSDQSDDADQNQNYVMNLNNDISELNNNLKEYVTELNQDVIVNIEEIRKLLLLYKCPTKITNQKDCLLLIQAVLQRHIIETIFSDATKYFQSTGKSGQDYLESDIINKASLLSTLLANASKYRTGSDEIIRVASTNLHKQVYLILDNCGFTDIKSNTIFEHPFITFCKKKLNNTMNELRIIKGQQEKIAVENLAATIIREVIKIFWFRLKVYEPFVLQYVWIPYNAKVNEKFMEGENFDDNDNENLYVDLCYFPLIGRDFTSNNHKVYVPAKVFVRKNQ